MNIQRKQQGARAMAVHSIKRLSVSSMLARLAMAVLLFAIGGQSALAERTTTFYHNDALGSVVAASDASGQLLWRKEYAPFGEQLDSTAENEKLAYTGKEHDDATGLTYFGARYYDPYLGRFMGVDPAGIDPGDPFTFNRYSYGNNNPYRFIDPDGRQSADTSCDETCEYERDRQRAARGARMVAEGASDVADVVGQEASSPWNWVGLGWGKKAGKLKGLAEKAGDTGRGLWKITKEGTAKTMRHKVFGTFHKSKSDGLWWSKDKAGHGGSAWKVFEETADGLKWKADADQFGDFIKGKHKSDVGTLIPWSQLAGVATK